MKIEVETLVDGPQYRRVPSTRDAIHRGLILQLIKKGVDETTIKIASEGVSKGGRCCPQEKVTCYGFKKRATRKDKKRTS